MMADLIKILAICLLTLVLCVILRQKIAEYSLLLSVAGATIIGILLFKNLSAPISIVKEKIAQFGLEEEYFKIALKALGIGYITSFISDACRDSGQTLLATKAELAGKCAIFALSLPLILSVLETAVGFIK